MIQFIILFCLLQVPQDLADCPDSPNCVNSYQDTEGFEAMEPLVYSGSKEEAMERLRNIIEDMPRTKITVDEENYLHAVFTIAVFGFKDDVEFLADPDKQLIHFRSASRKGYYDFGVNRNRMEKIQEAWKSE